MGDSGDEFRASGGRLQAGGPQGGARRLRLRRLRPPRLHRPPGPAPPGPAETAAVAASSSGVGDAAAEEGGGGRRCRPHRQMPPRQQQQEEEEAAAQRSAPEARKEEEEEEMEEPRARRRAACGEEMGDRFGGCCGAVPQGLQPESLEEAGWVFCQICQKDLSAMNSIRREQHVNRCLDDLEGPLSGPPARGPPVPECPICGKGFSSLKSRGSHLKRCAARMEVPPMLLLEAVRQQQQQQQRETLPLGPPAAQSSSKRKGASSVHRRPKKCRGAVAAEVDGAMEDLLVAMAMSRSLEEEQEGKARRPAGSRQDRALQRRKPRKAEKKGLGKVGLALPAQPLLLRPDPQEASRRMETRVAQLLSEAEEEFPSTPLLPPSRLLGADLRRQAGGPCGSLWEASSLANPQATDFVRLVLLQTPEEGAVLPVALPSSGPGRAAEREQGPAGGTLLPGSPSGDWRERPHARWEDAEALQDLVELAREGLTLTQWQLEAERQEGPGQGWLPGEDGLQSSSLHPLEKPLPQRSCPQALPLGSLAKAFRGMVNNPHLSDIQFQLDSGEVLYAHLFVLYARCPRLMEMVACEGFLVAEEGAAGTRRLLLSDVSKEALGVFLSYLYTADVSVPRPLMAEVVALARRFGARELAAVCSSSCPPGPGVPGAEEAVAAEEEEDRRETFEELLRSMWLEEEEGGLLEGGQVEEEAESEEVGEQELEQIYAFAATQRKAAAGGPQVGHGDTDPWKALRGSAGGREPVAEGAQPSQLPPAAAAAAGTLGAGPGRRPPEEEHEDSAVLFPAAQGDCSGLSQQSLGAEEWGGWAASQDPGPQGLPGLLPLGSSSPKRWASSPGSPLALPSLAQSQRSPWGLPSAPPSGEQEQGPARNKGPSAGLSPGAGGTLERSLIVLLDSDEEAELAETGFSLAGAAPPGPTPGALQGQPSTEEAGGSSGRRPSLSRPLELGPGEPWDTGAGSPLLLRLASKGEDSWEEACSWRVPDTPLLGLPGLAQSPLAPGTEQQGPEVVGERPPTPSSTPKPPLPGPPLASSPVVVVGDSEEELDLPAPWPQSGSPVPEEGDSLRPSEEEEEEDDSLLCLAAKAPTPLGTPPPTSGVKSPPARSPMAGRAAAPHLGERGASMGEDSDSSESFPLTQRTPDLEAGRRTPRAAPPTPMPLYSDMKTPKLREELRRFGVRPLPKRKMILKLKEIFQYTHPGARASPPLSLPRSPAQPAPRKPRLALASSPTGKWLPGPAGPRQAVCASRGASGGGCEGPGQVSEGTASLPTGFPFGGSTKDSAPTASQESTASSGTGSDVSVASQSSSSMEFRSLVEEEEEEPVPASQAAAREAHKLEALRHHLTSRAALCRQILLYQPIELAGLQAELKASGIKIALGKLMDFLDAHCITFTTAEARREKQRHSRKRRRRF